jgi:NAD+ synthase (glutamine-hydrolysing)
VMGKQRRQGQIAAAHAERHGVAVATINQLGGNDDLIFDGRASVVVPTPGGPRVIAGRRGFDERTIEVDLPPDPAAWDDAPAFGGAPDDEMADLFDALRLGVRDYVRKTGFSDTIVGVSGGIDSAVTAAIAAAALGPERLLGVAMPSRYSSDHSISDAEALCRALGCPMVTTPIEAPHRAMEALLGPAFAGLGLPADEGITEENVQSRLRGTILMALSNKSGALVLTTGNKSELAVGYCTLYGDMNGALAVLADVSKIDVYRLARWMNEHHAERGFASPPIPEATIDKPPSAELRADQLDSDSLPPYGLIDDVIERYVERRQGVGRIVAETGFDPATVRRLVRMIDVSEYKRKQAPIGLKVSSVAFGRGRRRPLAQHYRPDRSPGA